MPKLVIRNQILADVSLPFQDSVSLVGRGPEAHVRIDHSTISRVHARFERTRSGWVVVDLDSRNGTFLNGKALDGPSAVDDGDELRFGGVDVRFENGAQATTSAPPTGSSTSSKARADATSARDATAALEPGATEEAPPLRSNARLSRYGGVALALVVGLCAGLFWRFSGPNASDDRARSAIDAVDPTFPDATPSETPSSSRPEPPSPPSARNDASPSPPSKTSRDESPVPEARSRPKAESDMASAMSEAEDPPTSDPTLPEDDPAAPRDDAPARPMSAEAAPPTSDAPGSAPKPDVGGANAREQSPPIESAPAKETEPPPPPLPPPPERTPTPEERFKFRRLAFDLLGRPPYEAELRRFAAASFEATVDALLKSPERWESWFEDELYELLLIDEFRPGPDRIGGLPTRLAEGSIGVLDALAEIAKSQQFNARNPGNDTYVTVVLEQFLGVVVQNETSLLEAGKKMYDGRATTLFGKSGRSQSDFVDLVVSDRRFAPKLVARRAAALLNAEPTRSDLARWSRLVVDSKDGYRAMEREILLSKEWERGLSTPKKKSDRRFMTGLWCDVFGRVPDYQELRNLRNASQALTDPAGLRSVVVGSILGSPDARLPDKDAADARSFVVDAFLRLLCRPPTQAEATAFAEAWATKACRPSTVLHALLTSSEYDHY